MLSESQITWMFDRVIYRPKVWTNNRPLASIIEAGFIRPESDSVRRRLAYSRHEGIVFDQFTQSTVHIPLAYYSSEFPPSTPYVNAGPCDCISVLELGTTWMATYPGNGPLDLVKLLRWVAEFGLLVTTRVNEYENREYNDGVTTGSVRVLLPLRCCDSCLGSKTDPYAPFGLCPKCEGNGYATYSTLAEVSHAWSAYVLQPHIQIRVNSLLRSVTHGTVS